MTAENFIPDTYDPVKYWNDRKQPNTAKNPGISPGHTTLFNRYFSPGKKIMELGPGVGRLFPLYSGAASVSTLDISSQHRELLRKLADENNFRLNQKISDDPNKPFPFKQNEFDIGVSSFVFIHIPFDMISHTISELARVSRNVICFVVDEPIWPKDEASRKPSSHCFSHDYRKIIKECGCKIIEWDQGKVTGKEVEWVNFVYTKQR